MEKYDKGDKVEWMTIFEGKVTKCTGWVSAAMEIDNNQIVALRGTTPTGMKLKDTTYSDDKSLKRI